MKIMAIIIAGLLLASIGFAGTSQYNTPQRDASIQMEADKCYLGATNLVEDISVTPVAITNFSEAYSGILSTANPTNGTITVGRDGTIIVEVLQSFSANIAVDMSAEVAIDGVSTGYGIFRDVGSAATKGSGAGAYCGPVTNGQVISILVTGDNSRTLTYQSLSVKTSWQD